jgi:hypothetical protein
MGKEGKKSKSSKKQGGAAEQSGELERRTEPLRTTNPHLQAKLDALAALAAKGDRAGFVQVFVPLDLTPAEAASYLHDLTEGTEESEHQWAFLAAEIGAIASGAGVEQIKGNQVSEATFYFAHPLMEGCDREVVFVCNGNGDWRAQG